MLKNFIKLKYLCTVFTIILISASCMGTASAGIFSPFLSTYTISGKVTNKNQEPMPGVEVVIMYNGIGGKIRAVTDDLGNYVLNPVAGVSGIIAVSKMEYRTIRDAVHQYYQKGRQYVWNFTIQPDWMSGKVTDQRGTPIEGVKITFEQNGGTTGVQTIFTDQDGNYKYTLPADYKDYWVTVTKEGYSILRERWQYIAGGAIRNITLR